MIAYPTERILNIDDQDHILLPVASLAYLFWPMDAIPIIPVIGALDDAAILWIGSTLFVELCPPTVVKEYEAELASNLDDDPDDVVDAEIDGCERSIMMKKLILLLILPLLACSAIKLLRVLHADTCFSHPNQLVAFDGS